MAQAASHFEILSQAAARAASGQSSVQDTPLDDIDSWIVKNTRSPDQALESRDRLQRRAEGLSLEDLLRGEDEIDPKQRHGVSDGL